MPLTHGDVIYGLESALLANGGKYATDANLISEINLRITGDNNLSARIDTLLNNLNLEALTRTNSDTANTLNISNLQTEVDAISTNPTFNSIGVGVVASGVTGDIRVLNDVIGGISDPRLKDVITNIKDGLNKVKQLNGFIYKTNELGLSLGIPNSVAVGLSAAEVNNVLPEATCLAPFDSKMDENNNLVSKSGDNYLTVKYERITALLVEAIKDLDNKVSLIESALVIKN